MQRSKVGVSGIVLTLILATFFLPPLTLFAQRLSITPPAMTVMEGGFGEFTVVLSLEPAANVTVTVVRSDGTDINLDKPELTFTPANWNIPQKVTVTAAEDEDITDDNGSLILIANGGGYDGDGVIVSPETARILSLGKSTQLNAVVHDQNGSPVTGVAFDWSSTDPSVAVVDSTGKVTSVNFGVTTITTTLATVSGAAEISVGGTPLSDREILEILFQSTEGEKWKNREGWLTDAPLDRWHGVGTDTEGHVMHLKLSENNLRGPVPPELGNLTQLIILRLDGNNLSGPVPPELGNLVQLTDLALHLNHSLSGRIPPEFGKLTQLEFLGLGANSHTGPIPPELGNLTQLRSLSLISNELSGPIPPELGKLTQLKELMLNINFLSGPIPPELDNLAQLQIIDLSWNNLSGPIPPELGNLAQLEALGLRGNFFSGPIPPELANLTQLKTLGLESNDLSGLIPPEFGNLTQLVTLSLESNDLSGPIPPELANLTQLKTLGLESNDLSGLIPPEFGNLTQLVTLSLESNDLSGLIPPEFGNLTQLVTLKLNNNNDLEGLLPRSLLNLSLGVLRITDTGICKHQDAVFLEWWDSLPNRGAEDCTSRQIERLALMELHDKTNGASWANASGWGSDTPLGDWHGVTVENGRVTELSLSNNSLSGPIPGDVANFTELSVLNLANNSLAGALPEELSLLPDLTELRVNGNTGLDGILRDDLTNLEKLEVLHFGGTSLCAPPERTFQAWYGAIGSVSGSLCSNPAEVQLDVQGAYLTQSMQTLQNSVRLIEGRDAMLRVFVTGDKPAFFEHKVVATVRGGGRTHQVEMTRDRDRIAMEVDESNLANSFNAVIPGDVITPGATLVVEADPDGVIPRTDGSQDRFPVTGEESLHVVSVPDMEVTVVPVLEANQPDRSIFDWTNNIEDDSPEVGLLKYAFPFHEFRARSREAYVTSLDLTSDGGQWGLVLELEALRLLDNETGYYYGAAASVNGFVRGRARLGGWASMGKAWDTELAHEVGHNLRLLHAPCGRVSDADPDFPHRRGSVGAWGYDFRDGSLISPEYHKDIMGYCYDRGWLSDYYFEKVIDYREQHENASGPPMTTADRESDVLVLWGGVRGGELQIEPPFPATVPAQLSEADGQYRLDGLGQNTIIFSLSFTPGEDKFGDKYFFFAIPIEQDWEESLERIVLTGPEGSLTIGADDQQTFSIVRDASTGRVHGFLRDWDGVLPTAFGPVENLRILTTQSLSDAVRLQR